LLRIIIIVLAALILFRLISSLFRSTGGKSRRTGSGTRPGKKVGEGKILKDEIDEENNKSG
jgi:hypothetical protein